MTYTEIVKKLIGDIQPSGATHINKERFENLKQMCDLVNDLITEIDKVAVEIYRPEHSIKEMSTYANDFLKRVIGITD